MVNTGHFQVDQRPLHCSPNPRGWERVRGVTVKHRVFCPRDADDDVLKLSKWVAYLVFDSTPSPPLALVQHVKKCIASDGR